MNEQIKFEIKLKTKDLWQFSMYHANSGTMGVFNLIFTVLAFVLLVFRWNVITNGNRLLLVCCLMIFTVLQPLLLYNKVRKQAKLPMFQRPMYLTFDEKGLNVEQGEQKAEFAWEQMGRMDKKPTMVVLYMDRVHAYLLPKNVLGEQEKVFYDLVKTHLPKERRRGF